MNILVVEALEKFTRKDHMLSVVIGDLGFESYSENTAEIVFLTNVYEIKITAAGNKLFARC